MGGVKHNIHITVDGYEHKKDVIGKPEFVEVAPPLVSKELKRRWSYFIIGRRFLSNDP